MIRTLIDNIIKIGLDELIKIEARKPEDKYWEGEKNGALVCLHEVMAKLVGASKWQEARDKHYNDN